MTTININPIKLTINYICKISVWNYKRHVRTMMLISNSLNDTSPKRINNVHGIIAFNYIRDMTYMHAIYSHLNIWWFSTSFRIAYLTGK